MRSGILVSLIVVVLCACGIAAERPAQFSRGDIIIALSGDPNEPNVPAGPRPWDDPNQTWDPAEHLSADWESVSVSMASRLYNPAIQPNQTVQGPQWSFSIAAIVDIIDSTGLIGWTNTATSVKAFAADGSLIASSAVSDPIGRWYHQPRSWTAPAGFPGMASLDRFSLNLPVDPNANYPELLSRVEWTMNVLLAEEIKTVDVPFEPNETWVELTPGMEIKVEQATAQQGKYQYSIKVRYDNTKVDYLMSGSLHLWRDEQPPAAAVLKMEVLNAEGQSVRGSGGGSFSSGASYSGSTGTASGSGSCATCGDAAILRYTLGFGLYEQEARFVLENIPVPEF